MDEHVALQTVPLFSSMDEAEISALHEVMEERSYVPGQVIIYEGEPGDLFHILVVGTVVFLTVDADGNELIIDEEGPGSYFGELSILTSEPRSVRVRAKGSTTTLTLNRDQFHAFLLKHPHAAIDVLGVIGRRLHKTDMLLRHTHARNVNEVVEERLTLGQRIADNFAATMGSWRFIIIQSVILVFWVVLNVVGWERGWDPYPFILLNLALSFQAAYAAPIIMMSQNRQADKDRIAAEIDHEVNVRAEMKAGLLMSRLDDLEKGIHELHRQHVELFRANSR